MTTPNEIPTPRSNQYTGMLASMPQLATMFGEMVTLERELAAMTGAHAAAQDECRSLGAIIDESQDERDAYRSERNEARMEIGTRTAQLAAAHAARNELAIECDCLSQSLREAREESVPAAELAEARTALAECMFNMVHHDRPTDAQWSCWQRIASGQPACGDQRGGRG